MFVLLSFSFVNNANYKANQDVLVEKSTYLKTFDLFVSKIVAKFTGNENSADLGVREFLGVERYEYMLQNNPGLISDLKLRFRFGVYLIDWNPEKQVPYKELENITLMFKEGNQSISTPDFVQQFMQGQINPLRIDLPFERSQQSFFILKNTGKALVMNSWENMRMLSQTTTN
jgi:hypothetical protein